MTLEDILTLSKAGYTAQQITDLNQQSFQRPQAVQNYPQPQVVQPQAVQNYPQPQVVQPQAVQNYPQPQVVQPQAVQNYPQPQVVQNYPQPQVVQPQAVQNYPQFASNGQYNPVLPQNTTAPIQADPMKDVMLEQYMNVPNMNMYDVKGVVADMIGANPPINPANNTGGVR